MTTLENRIPPPIVVMLVAAVMGLIAWATPHLMWSAPLHIGVAVMMFAFALGMGGSGLLAFRRARTTIDPVHLEAASALVTGGIFRFSRNPMYVGFALLLTAWAIYLSAPWALTGVAAFVWFTWRFQIVPEERAMHAKFGVAYAAYQGRVRRWL